MKIPFRKMNGTGNDFIMINHWRGSLPIDFLQIAPSLCHRRFGIGGDGVIVIEPSSRAGFKMRIINSDGSEAEMCGNGIRCAFRYVHDEGLLDGVQRLLCETKAGLLEGRVLDSHQVAVKMTKPQNMTLNCSLKVQDKQYKTHLIDTGVPHAIIFCDNLKSCDLESIGKDICFHPFFGEKQTNVDCVELINKRTIRLRTYERGVYAETWACGTGATASALLSHVLKKTEPPTKVIVNGGELMIDFKQNGKNNFEEVVMTGLAQNLFDGEWLDV